MVNRIKTIFFILVLSVSVFSGVPLQGGDMNMRGKVCPMKCCQKKKATATKPKSTGNARYLCRVLVCSENMPTNTTANAQVNLAPALIISEKTALFEILFSTRPKEAGQRPLTARLVTRRFLPKYIQHQRILI